MVYDLDVMISVGYRVKSIDGVRFRRWSARILCEMLLNRLDEVKRIGALECRLDSVEEDVKQLKGGMKYIVQQITTPPPDSSRRPIGFVAQSDD